MKETWASPLTKKRYHFDTKETPIMMCDILGFKNLVLDSDISDLKNIFISLIDGLSAINQKNLGRKYFTDLPSVFEKLEGQFPESYNLKYTIVSDTILIYPDLELRQTPLNSEMELLMLSVASGELFAFLLKNYSLLIRGTIHCGEYCEIDPPKVVFGKAIIGAYEYETMQNWGGILLSPSLCEKNRGSPILITVFTEYLDLPIKSAYKEKFEKECLSHSSLPHVLNWTKTVDTVDWTPIYDRAKKIENLDLREKVIKKIDETKKFFEGKKRISL